METCDEATAKFMGEALLNHAREICRYARTYSAQTHPEPEREKFLRERYARNLTRMLKEMHALMLMAKYKGISRYCNCEQIEAYVEDACNFVPAEAHAFTQSAPQLN